MSKIVKAPLVVAKAANGQDVYVYQGAPLPDGLAEGEEKRLADFLEDAKAAEDEGGAKKPARKSTTSK